MSRADAGGGQRSSVVALAWGGILSMLLLSGGARADPPEAPRHALVIGNRSYPSRPVKSALNDAQEMRGALEALGFDVELRENLGRQQMEEVIAGFGKRLEGGGTAIFYFSGHGVQAAGKNYLVPVDANIQRIEDISKQAVALDLVLSGMGGSGPNIVILDACRDSPFPPGVTAAPGWTRGLSDSQAGPSNTIIAYATSPGQTTPDTTARLSPYTAALLQHIQTPGLRLSELFMRVRLSVAENADRITWVAGSQTSEYFLQPASRATFHITEADDDVMVLLNGNVIATAQHHGRTPIDAELLPGTNPLSILVYNQRTLRGGVPVLGGRQAEGWSYAVTVSAKGLPARRFHGEEPTPIPKGPRHGKLFVAATASLVVDKKTGNVRLEAVDEQVWRGATPAETADSAGAVDVEADAVPFPIEGAAFSSSTMNLRLVLSNSGSESAADVQARVAGQRGLWERLSRPLAAAPVLWLSLNPEEVAVGPVQTAGGLSWVTVAVTCRPVIRVSRNPPPVSPRMPSFRSVGVTPGQSELYVHAEIPLSFIQGLLADEMAEQRFVFTQGVESKVAGVAMREREGKVVLDVDLEGPITGRVVLTGTLAYDPPSQCLVLDDAEVSFQGDAGPPPEALAALRRNLATQPLWRLTTDLGSTRQKLADVLKRGLGAGARVSVDRVDPRRVEVKPGIFRVSTLAAVDAEVLLP